MSKTYIYFKNSIFILLLLAIVLTPLAHAMADETNSPVISAPVEGGVSTEAPTPAEEPKSEEVDPKENTDPTVGEEPTGDETKDEETKKEEEQPQAEALLSQGGAESPSKFQIPTQSKASVDQSTGSLQYSYPIDLPDGRAGMTPELSLRYDSRNSSKPDTLIGLGWETSIPYIQREPVKGVDNLYSKAYFSSSVDGNLIATTDTTSSQFTLYRPQSDSGQYTKYTYSSSNSWTVTGKDGRTYTYGGAAASRQDNPADTSKVYKWMLSKIVDTHGNEIQYTYIKDNGQIYPNQIIYTYNPTSPAIHSVTFNYTTPANYGTTVYSSGFAVKTLKLMSSILVKSSDGINPDITATYTFSQNQTSAPSLKLQNLHIIQRTASIPNYAFTEDFQDTTIFDYSIKTPGWQQGTYSLSGLGLPTDANGGWVSTTHSDDFDKNGFTDLLISTGTVQKLLLNNGTNFVDSTSSWSVPSQIISAKDAILDLNGDHLPDLQPRQYDVGETPTPVYLNNGSGFVSQSNNNWDISHYVSESSLCGPNVGDNVSFESNTFLYDINNDGKNDIIYFGGTSDFRVFLNNGNGWTQSSAYAFTPGSGQSFTIAPNCTPNPPSGQWQTMIDINGDGNFDYVNQSRGIFLNTGTGFLYSTAYSVAIGQPSRSGFADINGDGLVDLVTYANNGGNSAVWVYLNNGSGFITSGSAWNPSALQWSSTSANWGTLIDVTADGFPDAIAKVATSSGGMVVQGINDGVSALLGTAQQSSWSPMALLNETLYTDIDADGVLDFVTSKTNFGGTIYNSLVHMGKPAVSNRLTKITTPFGGKTLIDYGTAPTNLDDTHIAPISVVKKITEQNAGQGQPDMVTQYSYIGGEYIRDPATLQVRFTGFHKVTATESGSNLTPLRVTDSYFMQANGSDSSTNEPTDTDLALIGKTYYSITKNPTGTPKKETWNKYSTYTLVTEPVIGRLSKFVYPTETVSKITDSVTSTGTAEAYAFDTSLGEQTSLTNLGFVTVASDGSYTDSISDSRYSFTEYSSNSNGTIVKPKRQDVRTSPVSSDTIARTDFYYDAQALGSIGSYGDLTKESSWISGNGSTVADTTYTYDSYGNIATATNPRSAVTTYTYDSSKSYVATETNHLNQTTTYAYNLWMPSSVTDPNGRVTTFAYTKLGYLYTTNIQNTAGTQVVRQYIANFGDNGYGIEHFQTVDTGLNNQSLDVLDNFGRTIRVADLRLSDGKFYLKKTNTYDALGRIISESAPYGTGSVSEATMFTATVPSNLVTTTTYDVFDRPLSVANVIGTTTMSYAGVETTTTDANNHQKKTSADAYGNLVQVKEYNNSSVYTTNYTYDNRNLLTGITDALGNVRAFSYNNAGWATNSEDLHAVGDSNYGSLSYTYDNNGNRLTETQPNGTVVTRVYDMLDRATSIDSSTTSGTDYTFTYDTCTNGKGYVCSVSGILPNSVTMNKSFVYGISGAPTSTTLTTLGNSYTTSYEYNLADQVKKTIYPNTTAVRYSFGDWGLPTTEYITLPSQTETTFATASYGVTGQPDVVTITNGPTITYTYDATKLYRKTNMTAVKGGSTVQSYAYVYDSVGNITSITEPNLAKTYTYDDLNRLTQAVHTPSGSGATTYSYAYDAVGNITNANGNAYTYSGAGKTNPHAVTSVGSNNYTYDDNGNMATAPNQTFTYNWQNQLVSTVVGGSTTITSAYDESGNRFIYQTPSNTEIQAADNYLLRNGVAEISLSLGGLPVGTVSGTSVYSAVTDHLGTPVKQLDSTGAVSESVSYDPFGGILSQTGSLNTKKGYTGHEEDVDTGLVYAQARYYNPGIGRFSSQDPLFISAGFDLSDPQSMNSYSYTENNPIGLIDPGGNIAVPWETVLVPALEFGGAVAGTLVLGAGAGAGAGWSYNTKRESSVTLTPQEKAIINPTPGGFVGPVKPVVTPYPAPTAAKPTIHITPLAPAPTIDEYVTINGLEWYVGPGPFHKNTISAGDIRSIGTGHAFPEHKHQFPGVGNSDDLVREVGRIINSPDSEVRNLERGRTGFWDNDTGTVVIHDPGNIRDKGTIFKPNPKDYAKGKKYFNNLK
jgi:RHS repeat-associated protein